MYSTANIWCPQDVEYVQYCTCTFFTNGVIFFLNDIVKMLEVQKILSLYIYI